MPSEEPPNASTLDLIAADVVKKEATATAGTEDLEEDASALVFPPELLLLIASFLPPAGHLRMTMVSREWHRLLIPDLIRRAWGRLERLPYTKEQFAILAKDSLNAGKFKRLKALWLQREHLRTALHAKVLEQCALSLASLTVYVHSHEDVLDLCEISFPNLQELHLVVVFASAEMETELYNEVRIRSPRLRLLSTGGHVNFPILHMLDASVAAMPVLKVAGVGFGPALRNEEDIHAALIADEIASRSFLMPKIRSWVAFSPELLFAMIKHHSGTFRPIRIQHLEDEPLSRFPDVWKAVRELPNLKLLQVSLKSSDLLGPLPSAIAHLEIRLVYLDLEAMEDDMALAVDAFNQWPGSLAVVTPADARGFRLARGTEAVQRWAAEATIWVARRARFLRHGDLERSGVLGGEAQTLIDEWVAEAMADDDDDDLEDGGSDPSENDDNEGEEDEAGEEEGEEGEEDEE
jgi:hypothetical protein